MREVIKYLVSGLITTVINIVLFFILTSAVFNPDIPLQLQITNIISWIVSVFIAYILNKKYVFEPTEKSILHTLVSFYISRVFTLLVEMLILFIGVTLLGFSSNLIKVISNGVVIILNYIISKFITFKK